jgi:serine/threonine-protein kinase
MNSERWERLQTLFHRATGLDPGERARWLTRECPADDALRREVEALLAADGDDRPLSAPIGAAAGELAEGALAPGDVVGSYRVVRELGRGGMGIVYLAERTGEDFEQQVALKVLAGVLASPRAVERFIAERRILAQLEHPLIARLLDGGTTEEGAPWFAMERVEGEPIDAWCDRRQLPVEGRLRLFVGVCDAVQHAHRRLVVHRDLKPSNVLIGADGAPKLLDFGIAKLLDPDTEGSSLTRLGELPMTPEYASPEQVRGQPVTTASDVYALGLLLYELLTSRRAHRLSSYQRRDVERAVCEEPATRPSQAAARTDPAAAETGSAPRATRARPTTPAEIAEARRTTPKALRRRLAGDLDTIVLAALRKEPEQRYGSVEAFADDVRRHLDGLPVRARGDRLGYRAGKFVRRHRAAVAAAALAAVSLIAAAAFSTWGLLRARAAEAEARREAAAAEQVAGFLEELFAASDPARARGSDLTAREILDAGVERIRDGLGEQPEVRARLLYALGRTYNDLGLKQEAITLVDEAAGIQERLFGPEHPDSLRARRVLGRALVDLGLGQNVSEEAGRMEEGEEILRLALRNAESSLGADDPVTLHIRSDLGLARLWRYDLEEAEALQEATLAGRRRVLGAEHPDTLASMNNLASVHLTAGRLEQAGTLLREAVGIGTRVRGRDHPATLDALTNLATTVGRQGRDDEALALYREVIELRRRVLGPDHTRTVRTMLHLANLYAGKGAFEDAERSLLEIIEIQERSLGEDHPETLWSTHRLAELYSRSGELERAWELASEVFERRRVALGAGLHVDLLWSRLMLGGLALELGRPAEAERHFREAKEGFIESAGVGGRAALLATLGLANSLTALGRHEDAALHLADSRRRQNELFPDDSWHHALVLLAYGRHLLATGRKAEAEEALRTAREEAGSGFLARDIATELARLDGEG